ncbi:MAG: DNA-binding response regulator [Anaerolineaceae bacterium]|nr:MAG: DNA-binding response regulator [Anaerolineaceae bacterium]
MSAKILIVEDDESMARILQINLADTGYEVILTHDGQTGLRKFDEIKPDVVMLDIVLPDMTGHDVCRRIRHKSNVPILMMSATAITEEDIAEGLDIGADEYMLKPLGNIELAARLKALMRRTTMEQDARRTIINYEDDYMSIDISSRRVYIEGREVRLTPTEFSLLTVFVQNEGQVLSFGEILEKVWGPEYDNEHHYPRIYVSHLRRKIEPDYKNPTYIHNEYGVGYRFVSNIGGGVR